MSKELWQNMNGSENPKYSEKQPIPLSPQITMGWKG
jgi:hypothetical protein